MQPLNFDRGPYKEDAAFERRLDQALATAPQPPVPADFAARMAALVPARESSLPQKAAYARISIILSAVALFVALLLIAPHASTGSTFAIALEWILCAQLSLLALYVALPGSSWRSAR